MRNTFKILFYINRQKTKADGNTTIFYRITIDGKSTAITTGEECNPSEWNTKQGLTTNRQTNQRFNEFWELIEKTYRTILVKEGVVSVELIKNSLQGIATNPTTLLAMSKVELQTIIKSANLHPEERVADEEEVVINRQLKGYVPLYSLPMIIALSFLLDSTEAHLFRMYIYLKLQKSASMITPVFLLGNTNN